MIFSVGDILLDQTVPGADRSQIEQFSQGTEDPNPIHVDEAFAKSAGFPTVLQQGPMTTAHFARLLTEQVGPNRLRTLDINFTAPVFPEEPLRLKATVERVDSQIQCTLTAAKSDGTLTARGTASIALSEGS